jgi:hypothetical protein
VEFPSPNGQWKILAIRGTIYQLRRVLATDRQLKRASVDIPNSAKDKPQEGKEATQAFFVPRLRKVKQHCLNAEGN